MCMMKVLKIRTEEFLRVQNGVIFLMTGPALSAELPNLTLKSLWKMFSPLQIQFQLWKMITEDLRELSFGELSALCSNLSKGCAKQYRSEEADLFNQLSEFYKSKTESFDEDQLNDIAALINEDLSSGLSAGKYLSCRRTEVLCGRLYGEKK